MIRTYNELIQYETLEDRYTYLRLGGILGAETFGFDRWMNQAFYRSREWRQVRDEVLVRDNGMDLGVEDTPLASRPAVHHMNPITMEDLDEGTENLLSPEFLICASQRTHNAIHYGDKDLLPQPYVERRPGDTRLWG